MGMGHVRQGQGLTLLTGRGGWAALMAPPYGDLTILQRSMEWFVLGGTLKIILFQLPWWGHLHAALSFLLLSLFPFSLSFFSFFSFFLNSENQEK